MLNAPTDWKPRHVVLIGFMGAGKSTVAPGTAVAVGLGLCDTDFAIEEEVGIRVAEIFRQRGEPAFRELEAATLRKCLAGPGSVIATGGGAVCSDETMALLRQNALVVWMDAPFPLLLERALIGNKRPLLEGAAAQKKAKQLYESRRRFYAQAHTIVDASAPLHIIMRQIEALWLGISTAPQPKEIEVKTTQRNYSVHVGSWCFPQLAQVVPVPVGRALVVSDSTVAPLYGRQVAALLENAGWEAAEVVFPAGEANKNLANLRKLYKACAQAKLERGSVIFAVGGGVTGDMAGLAAATWLRGVPFVQVPTTLLAQVDASVGGKVAVDTPEGKNLVGAFHQPWAVMADVTCLLSLPHRELLSGLAEVIKHGLIADAELFDYVEQNLEAILGGNLTALAWCVTRSCEIKGAFVAADEHEDNQRAILNFGHTTGHGLEALTGYAKWTHGEAVAMGMVTAAKLSVAQGLPQVVVDRLVALLKRAGLPVVAFGVDAKALWEVMQRDKKTVAGKVRFVLLTKLGEAVAGQSVAEEEWARHFSGRTKSRSAAER